MSSDFKIFSRDVARQNYPNLRMAQRMGTAEEHKALLDKQTHNIPYKGEIFIEETDEDDSDGSISADISDVNFDEVAKTSTDNPVVDPSVETLVASPHYSVIMSTATDTVETPNLLPEFLYKAGVDSDGYPLYKAIIRQTYKTNNGNTAAVDLETPNLLQHAIVMTTSQWASNSSSVLAKGQLAIEITD